MNTKKTESKDLVCDECGLIHRNGISWHGRCYKCGGELVEWNIEDYEFIGYTPKGIQIYQNKINTKNDKTTASKQD